MTVVQWLWDSAALFIGRAWLVALVLLAAAITAGIVHDRTRRRDLHLTEPQRLRLIDKEYRDG